MQKVRLFCWPLRLANCSKAGESGRPFALGHLTCAHGFLVLILCRTVTGVLTASCAPVLPTWLKLNLAVLNLAVRRPTLLGSCSHEILQSQNLAVQIQDSCPTCEILQSRHSPDLAVIPQPVLQSSKCACNCLAVLNLAVINLAVRKPTLLGSCSHEILQSCNFLAVSNLAVIHLAVRKPTLLGSCSHEILQSQIFHSRSKILVPLARSCSHVTVQTLQSSHIQSCSPPK